ncbi:hypothetical protein VIMY103929_07920 [Vibrio mytili]
MHIIEYQRAVQREASKNGIFLESSISFRNELLKQDPNQNCPETSHDA